MVAGVLIAAGGFLLGVLWMDLMFDILAARRGGTDEVALTSVAAYYHRATTTSQPMGRLIAVVMVVLLVALGIEAIRAATPGWLLGLSAVLAGGPICLAALRTVPNAVRLGRRTDDVATQTRLARSILLDHTLCASGMVVFLTLWLTRSLN